jgi:hypothetical protein
VEGTHGVTTGWGRQAEDRLKARNSLSIGVRQSPVKHFGFPRKLCWNVICCTWLVRGLDRAGCAVEKSEQKTGNRLTEDVGAMRIQRNLATVEAL